MILDLVIKFQAFILAGLGASVALALYIAARRGVGWVKRLEFELPTPLRAFPPARLIVPFWVVVIGITLLLGRLRPVPATVGLEATELETLRNLGSGQRLIILLHGWNGDAEGTWRQFPELMRHDSRLKEFVVINLAYPTYMARRNLRVAELSHWLADELRRGGAERFDAVFFIAHSMGGVIAREIVVQHRLAGLQIRYSKLVEIGAPHDGARVAGLASALGLSPQLTEDLVGDSGFLVGLRQHWNQLGLRPDTFCVTSPQDDVVDERSATAQCDREFRYPQWGHSELVKPQDRNDIRYRVPVEKVLE